MQQLAHSLILLPKRFGICRLDARAFIPDWAQGGGFVSLTRTADELSIVCQEMDVPGNIVCEKGWCCFKLAGPIPFTTVGVLASLVQPLALAKISLFAVSTFDTDYVLVKEADLGATIAVWQAEGHRIEER